MPTTTGARALPSPLAAEAPDGPGAFIALNQRLSLTDDPVANVASLPAVGAFAGQRIPVLSTPGAIWQWDGASWLMYGTAQFASTGARDAALTAPAAGMRARISGLDYEYTGVAWRADFEESVAAITVAGVPGTYTITAQRVRREGRVVQVTLTVIKNAAWTVSDTVGTINTAALRPTGTTAVGSGFDNNTAAARVATINTGGSIAVLGATGAAGANPQVVSVVYVIDF